MRTMSNYLIIMFSVLVFIFRLIVVFTTIMGIEFMVQSINVNLEIAYLFVMLISIILLSKNKLSGAILYLISSFAYFGPTLLSQFKYAFSSNISADTALEYLYLLSLL